MGRAGQDSTEVDRPTRHGSEETRNISEETFHQIRELIVHGKLAPGGRIVEADLADRLGVSRTPIRSALHRLQQEGYILVGPGSESKAKLSVAPLTREDSQELYSIVGRLEGLAALATASLEAQTRAVVVQKLVDLNEQLRELAMAGHGDPNTIFDLDMGFHQAIIEAGAGARLRSLHAAIKPQTERYWRLYASSILDQLGLSVGEHVLIIENLSNGSAEAAERAVQMNWQNGAERLSRVIATMGERGSW
ncbi:MAG: GntR family transcriptional regulator [Terriglobia bacterium]